MCVIKGKQLRTNHELKHKGRSKPKRALLFVRLASWHIQHDKKAPVSHSAAFKEETSGHVTAVLLICANKDKTIRQPSALLKTKVINEKSIRGF